MKKFILVLIAGITASCSNEFKEFDNFLDTLNGKISSIEMKSYDAGMKFGEISKENDSYEEFVAVELTEKGMIESIFKYEYSHWKEEGVLQSVRKFKYDGMNPIEYNYYKSNGNLVYKKKYEYIIDNMVHTAYYDEEGELLGEINYQYENGKLIKETVYDEEAWPIREINYIYDGNLVNASGKDIKTDKEIYYKNIQYDEKRRVIKVVECNDDVIKTIEVERDKDGHVIKSIGGRCDIYGYLDLAPVNKTEYYYEYEFDKHKNWIKRICFKGEERKPVEIVEREITYK